MAEKTSFLVKDDKICQNYKQIWDAIKNKLSIKFHSKSVYEEKYLKVKVKEFDGVTKTNFLSNGVPKENMHYTCITCITINSAMKIGKKNYPQVYLEECTYRIKKIKMSRFISTELNSESEPDSEAETKSNTELMAKLESSSDSD